MAAPERVKDPAEPTTNVQQVDNSIIYIQPQARFSQEPGNISLCFLTARAGQVRAEKGVC